MSAILKAREERSIYIREYYRNLPLVIIKANTPGLNKNPSWSKFLINYFYHYLQEEFSIKKAVYQASLDGNYWLLELFEIANLKERLVEIEDNHPLGRLIDLDLFVGKSVSRTDINKSSRKCFICLESASICSRSKKHSFEELNQKIQALLLDFFRENISLLLDEAITLEADLDPKFGLVSKYSSGSHPDMDYPLMMRAKTKIIKPLLDVFKSGYTLPLEKAFLDARKYGLIAEEAMFAETSGVNVYKGFIFIIAIVLAALGNCLQADHLDLFALVKKFGENLEKDFADQRINSTGTKAYRKYGIRGIRGEVSAGLPNVQKIMPLLIDYSKESLSMALISLIRDVEDTVLLKRAGSLEKYLHYRKLIGEIETYDLKLIKEITCECIDNNLSFGGSADLLIVAIFIKKVEGCFKLNYEGDLSDRSF
ncbi:MAG: citrate lyase holo-[acyl-carrier protein] synthase [Bacilli bacterium]|nr:citrate lyase holo-[acyl-carrier protein] synthase [Bacilli bacterium]